MEMIEIIEVVEMIEIDNEIVEMRNENIFESIST